MHIASCVALDRFICCLHLTAKSAYEAVGAEKSETRDDRKGEMQQILAGYKERQQQGKQRIDYKQERNLAWFSTKVVEAPLQRLPEIFRTDLANSNLARCNLYIPKSFFLTHRETDLSLTGAVSDLLDRARRTSERLTVEW